MKITVVQPAYYHDEKPDEQVAAFLIKSLETIPMSKGDLVVLPEYSNAGGLSDPEAEMAALGRAVEMRSEASRIAKQREVYICINFIEERDGKLKNSTYLYDTKGEVAFIYDKIHLPPSEVALGMEYGDGSCVCDLDGIRFGFFTCYDVYYNEQVERVAMAKPDIILVPGYQRAERTDIICAQAKLCAFRANSFLARSSYSMGTDERGGSSMIVAPDGEILCNMGKDVGYISAEIDPKQKYMRTAGFGGNLVRNDDFINKGLRPEVFK